MIYFNQDEETPEEGVEEVEIPEMGPFPDIEEEAV